MDLFFIFLHQTNIFWRWIYYCKMMEWILIILLQKQIMCVCFIIAVMFLTTYFQTFSEIWVPQQMIPLRYS